MMVYQHHRADHDPSGNPQRIYVLYRVHGPAGYASIEMVWDEGYSGRPESLRDVPELPSVNISKSDYHSMVRWARENDALGASEV